MCTVYLMFPTCFHVFSEAAKRVRWNCSLISISLSGGETKVVGAACWGHYPRLKMSVRDGAATMVTNVAGGGGGRPVSPNSQDGRSYLLQIYPRLAAQPTSCCNLRWVPHTMRGTTTGLMVGVLHVDKMRKLQPSSWQTEIWLIKRQKSPEMTK